MKRIGTYKIIFLLILTSISLGSLAQTIKAEVDRDNILIGEQVHLTLKVEGIRAAENYIRNWISIPDSINHLEVVEKGKIDTIYVGRDIIYQQTIAITSFDSGQWQMPALSLGVENKGTAVTMLSTEPLTINVSPIDVSQLKDYHDIKDIVIVENESAKWILIGVIALTLLSILAIYFYSRRKGVVLVEPPSINGKQSPVDWALAELEALKKQDLSGKDQIKQYYLKLSYICRQYFEMQLKQKALNQTTDEWMIKLQPLPVHSDTKIAFLQVLRLADTVKFAKYLPPASEQEQSLNVAKQMVLDLAVVKYANPVTGKTLSS